MKITGCLLTAIFMVGLLLDCTPNNTPVLTTISDSRTSIRPDSFLLFPFKDEQFRFFNFSPIESDKVWVNGTNSVFEIDLKTGIVVPLREKLGAWAFPGFKWELDPYEPEKVWFAQFDSGIIEWNKYNGQSTQFPGPRHALCFAFQPKTIWVGTANGLYRFDRAARKVLADQRFPNEPVTSISLKGDSLILNNNRYYLPKSGQTGEWRVPWADEFCRQFDYKVYEHGHTILGGRDEKGYSVNFVWANTGRLFKFGDEFQVRWSASSEKEVWANDGWSNVKVLDLATGEMSSYIFNQNDQPIPVAVNSSYVFLTISDACLLLEKKTGVFRVLPKRNMNYVQKIEMDDFNLYILYYDRFEVISLDWLRKNAISREQHLEKRARLAQVRMAFNLTASGFYPALSAYDSLASKYGREPDDQIKSLLSGAWNQVLGWIECSNQDTLGLIFKDIKAGKFNPSQQNDLRASIFRHYGRAANFKQAEHWGKELISLLDTSNATQLQQKEWVENNLRAIQRARFRFDSIEQYALLPDARLFAEADILLEYCLNASFFQREGGYDTQLAAKKWKEIIKKHPKSEWADNAEFQLLETRYNCYEGSPGPEAMRQYATLIDKYPDSELKPAIWMALAGWNLYPNEYEDLPRSTYAERLKIAERYLQLVRINFPEKTAEKRFEALVKRLEQIKERLLWDISIAPEKKEIQPGEPIRLIVTFKNKAEKKRELQLWSEGYWLLNFQATYLSEVGCQIFDAPFFEGEKPRVGNRSIRVNSGQIHREIIDLSKMANRRGQYGRFDFSKKGVYDIYLEITQDNWDMQEQPASARIFVN